MRNGWIVAVTLGVCSGLVGGGCATIVGMLGPTEFRHSVFAYRILRDAEGHFVSEQWMVDNFYEERGRVLPRQGPDFVTELSLDLDGDGTWEDAGSFPTYDLLLRHTRDAGTLWARTIPLSRRFDQTELRVLARLYVESVAGTGTVVTAVRQSDGAVEVTADARRYATQILEERPWAVGGYEAYLITFQVANVDQLSLSESSLWQRATIAFVRPGFLWKAGDYRSETVFPTVLVLGYSNLPEDFEAHASDFERFVESIDWLSDELTEVRQAVLDCTTGEMVRVVARTRGLTASGLIVRKLLSPDVTEQELECLRAKVPSIGLSFSARRTPYEVPATADVQPPAAPGGDLSPSTEPAAESPAGDEAPTGPPTPVGTEPPGTVRLPAGDSTGGDPGTGQSAEAPQP